MVAPDTAAIQGAISLMLVGAILYALRAIPQMLWKLVAYSLTVTIRIKSEEVAFRYIADWLSKHPKIKRARSLKITSFDYNDMVMTMGYGKHLLWEKGRPVLVELSVDDKTPTWGVRETISFTTFGRDQALIRSLVCRAVEDMGVDDRTKIFRWDSSWNMATRRKVRSMDSVILPSDQKSEMVQECKCFLRSRDRYAQLGIPYRLGWLLSGPPGGGKTSIVQALAGELMMNIYTLNLSSISSDNELERAFSSIPPKSILLIEDVDSFDASKKRAADPAEVPDPRVPPSPDTKQARFSVTTAGLLNAMDGVTSPEGYIVFMTTNHPEKLDPALVRKGRVDNHLVIAPLTADLVGQMAERFGLDEDERLKVRMRAAIEPLRTGAEWQDEFRRQTSA